MNIACGVNMVNFMMSVNRFCGECMKKGEFVPLRFVMINISSGMWMCPKPQCVFPMNSELMTDYIEEDLTTEKVLLLTKAERKRGKGEKKQVADITTHNLHNLQASSCSRSVTSNESPSSYSTNTSLTNESSSLRDDRVSSASSCSASKKTIYYPLWENNSLLCWLDSVLAMLVLNQSMAQLLTDDCESLITHLFSEYKKILVSFNMNFNYSHVKKQLDGLRKNLLKFFQPKLLANFGDEDSPLVCLPLVLSTSKKLSQALEISYSCTFNCDNCGFERKDGFQKVVMSLPNTDVDLNFNDNIYFSRCCYKCFTDNQKTVCKIERYPSVMFVHFPSGVSARKCWIDFSFTTPDGDRYIVTQIIQYMSRKRHFVTWSYSYEENKWIEGDDLKEPVVYHKYDKPRCRPHEVHMVIWERVVVLEALAQAAKKAAELEELDSPTSEDKQAGKKLGGELDSPTSEDKRCPSSASLKSSILGSSILGSDDLLLRSECSSRPSSVCSGDSISYDGRRSTPDRANPFRNKKDVLQKGLWNTPRYEPYVSRSGKKLEPRSGKQVLTRPTDKTTPTSDKTNNTIVGNIRKSQDVVSHNGVSFDFLKGVLSEELDALSDDLLLSSSCGTTPQVTQNSSASTESVSRTLWDFSAPGDLEDLYDLLDS